jgi:hypothetical protein
MHGVGAVFDLCFKLRSPFLRHTARKCFDASLRRRITVFSWLVPLWMAVSSQASALLFLASRGMPADPESFRLCRNRPADCSEFTVDDPEKYYGPTVKMDLPTNAVTSFKVATHRLANDGKAALGTMAEFNYDAYFGWE